MGDFSGTTYGMTVEASSPAFKWMKRNAFTAKITPCGWMYEKTAFCVRAADVAAVMGGFGWLVSELREIETIRWGNDGIEYYIIYEEN